MRHAAALYSTQRVSYNTCNWVMSHIWLSHVTHVDSSWQTCQRKESCRIYRELHSTYRHLEVILYIHDIMFWNMRHDSFTTRRFTCESPRWLLQTNSDSEVQVVRGFGWFKWRMFDRFEYTGATGWNATSLQRNRKDPKRFYAALRCPFAGRGKTNAHTHARTHTYTHTYTHIHTHTYIHTYTHTHTETHSHTNIHTHVYTHLLVHTYT